MDLLYFFAYLNYRLGIPTAIILLAVAFYFTLRLKFIQIRGLPRFIHLIIYGIKAQKKDPQMKTINPFHALFTAMSTSLGIGTIIGPSVAIIMGGPGALFWLGAYSLCASVTKFAEVTFAVHFREETDEGLILGGPMQYLNKVNRFLGRWYAYATMILFAGWSGLQSNVLAETLSQESIPEWLTGIIISVIVFIMLCGGAKRIGAFSSKLVPIMSILYISIGCFILAKNYLILGDILNEIFTRAFLPTSAIGGFTGASVIHAIRSGVYKGAYITESGMGTAAIPHSIANVDHPTDQGILAMVSVFADTALCILSGFLILTSNFWKIGYVSNILMYKVFQHNLPVFGRPILLITIFLFGIGTIIGNSFNGRQSFASITRYRYLYIYYFFVCFIIFFGAIADVPLVWAIIETLLPLVAIPNVLSLIYLSIKYKNVLKI
ncbi:MAG: amino acid carrier protein [Candidatus Babeliales bacterium]